MPAEARERPGWGAPGDPSAPRTGKGGQPFCWLRAHAVPGPLRTLTCSILTTTLQSVTPSRPHFTNEKTEVQRGYVTCPVSHSREEVSQGLFLDLTEWLFPGLTRGGGIKYRPQTQGPGTCGRAPSVSGGRRAQVSSGWGSPPLSGLTHLPLSHVSPLITRPPAPPTR